MEYDEQGYSGASHKCECLLSILNILYIVLLDDINFKRLESAQTILFVLAIAAEIPEVGTAFSRG